MAFTEATLVFLRGLQRHNEKDWFFAHRGSYDLDVRRPAVALAAAVAPQLSRLGCGVLDPAACVARQHRDRRFADVPPYWPHILLRFPMMGPLPARWRPAFTLRVNGDGAMVGAGVRDLGAELMARVRAKILDDDAAWARLRGRLPDLHGRQLRSVPREVPKDHRHVEDLRRKEFLARVPFNAQETTRDDFAARFVQTCRSLAPLNKFLGEALATP